MNNTKIDLKRKLYYEIATEYALVALRDFPEMEQMFNYLSLKVPSFKKNFSQFQFEVRAIRGFASDFNISSFDEKHEQELIEILYLLFHEYCKNKNEQFDNLFSRIKEYARFFLKNDLDYMGYKFAEICGYPGSKEFILVGKTLFDDVCERIDPVVTHFEPLFKDSEEENHKL